MRWSRRSPRPMPRRSASVYAGLDWAGGFSPDAASAGRRALRNTLLDYLAVLPGGAGDCRRHFKSATNMTDRVAALTVLAHRHPGSQQTQRALSAFEERYRGDALVLDKWFQIQATAPGADTLDSGAGADAASRLLDRATQTACARWSAPSPAPTRPVSTAPTAPAIASLPRRARRSNATIRNWRPVSPRRSGHGARWSLGDRPRRARRCCRSPAPRTCRPTCAISSSARLNCRHRRIFGNS